MQACLAAVQQEQGFHKVIVRQERGLELGV
jgi:hypothetical protein